MRCTIAFTKEAYKDIEESVAWYDTKSEMSSRFLQAIDRRTAIIIRNPKLYSSKYRHNQITLRAAPLEKFPFIIIYTLDEAQRLVVVFAVWHTAQDPLRWQQRL